MNFSIQIRKRRPVRLHKVQLSSQKEGKMEKIHVTQPPGLFMSAPISMSIIRTSRCDAANHARAHGPLPCHCHHAGAHSSPQAHCCHIGTCLALPTGYCRLLLQPLLALPCGCTVSCLDQHRYLQFVNSQTFPKVDSMQSILSIPFCWHHAV